MSIEFGSAFCNIQEYRRWSTHVDCIITIEPTEHAVHDCICKLDPCLYMFCAITFQKVATLMEFFCQQHWKILHFILMISQPPLSASITFLSISHVTSIWHLSLMTFFHFLASWNLSSKQHYNRVVHGSHSWAIFRSFSNSFLGHFWVFGRGTNKR